jgi:hypothetical protein
MQIAGGTGLTAFTQLLHQALFSSQPVLSAVNSRTHFTLLHGHQSPSALPPSIIADDFAMYHDNDGDRFTEHCFVEHAEGEMDDVPRGVELGRIGKETVERALLERGILLEEDIGDEPSSFVGSLNPWKKSSPRQKRRYLNPSKSVMILICGPEGYVLDYMIDMGNTDINISRMITALAGRRPRKSEITVEDVPVGGLLGDLGLTSSQVRRL